METILQALQTTEGYTLMGCVFGAIALRLFVNHIERSERN
jgi:hypothetical protein